MSCLVENYYTAYDSLPCGAVVFLLDDNYKIIYANKIYEDLFGGEFVNVSSEYAVEVKEKLNAADKPTKISFINANGIFVSMYAVKCGGNKILAVAADNTKVYEENKKLIEDCAKYAEAINGASEIFFEYDAENDKNTMFFVLESEHSIKSRAVDNFVSNIKNNKYVFEEDKEKIRGLTNTVIGDEYRFDLRMRLRECEEFEWYRVTIKPSQKKKIYIGNAQNINEIKEEERRLIEKISIDPLSKVYNRTTAIEKINEQLLELGEYEECALIVLDIDNFKNINDTFGHLYGDAVIAMAAGGIKTVLEDSDIIGRFGGDEFFVFSKNVERKVFEKKLENIRLAILKMRLNIDDENDISCSMGVSFGYNGVSFEEMFKQADSALYVAKANGKNRFEYFNGEYADKITLNYIGREIEVPEDESNESHDMTTVALEIASKSPDSESAISNLLRHIGVALDLNCIQILQYDMTIDKVNLDFQWWAEHDGAYNVVFNPKKSGYYDHSDLMKFKNRLEKEKIFKYTRDFKEGFSNKYRNVLEKIDSVSTVYASSTSNEEIFDVISYQSWNSERVFTEEEMNGMYEITKILSMFTKSTRTKTKRERQLEDMLDYTRGLYTLSKFYEEAGRIGREARIDNHGIAVIHFDFKHFYMFNQIYGVNEGNKVMDNFGEWIRSYDNNIAVSCYIPGTDNFVTMFRYDRCVDVQSVIEKELRAFCERMGNFEAFPLVIKAGMCLFEPGQDIGRAIYLAKELKHSYEGNISVCLSARLADDKV